MSTQLRSKVIYIMGVSGSGKTSIGQLLAEELSLDFKDADDYHPQANIEKMRVGIPLDDNDRAPWLSRLNQVAIDHLHCGCVIACSALKKAYRDKLSHSIENDVIWVYLKGDYDQIYNRMRKREDHFMEPKMLQSQFDALEEPTEAIEINISESPKIIVDRIKRKLTMKAEIGVIGMGVMGKSLSRNLARNGFNIALYNRHVAGKEENVAVNFKNQYAELDQALAHDDLSDFVHSLESPRKIILMVNAGLAIDSVLNELKNILDKGDIVIDGGNSHYKETNRRMDQMKSQGFYFIGTGVSGGEMGALNGPSIMPSGDEEAYAKIQKYLETIAAKDSDEKPCCTYVGQQGSGHFVKMIHNGIEYAEMQLLAECYSILKQKGMDNEGMADVFEEWMTDQGSYLLRITIDILRKKEGDGYLLDAVLDQAGNKGTGMWATCSVAESGLPATMIPAALFARFISFFKDQRQHAAELFAKEQAVNDISIDQLKQAYEFSRIVNHHQGFSLIDRVSKQNDWNVNLSEIARIWTEGCIIKSDLMKHLVATLDSNNSILFDEHWSAKIKELHNSIQAVIVKCLNSEIYIPCLLEAANYFHGLKTADGSANLIQAQRDYFGAHTYQRVDDATGRSHHSDWSA